MWSFYVAVHRSGLVSVTVVPSETETRSATGGARRVTTGCSCLHDITCRDWECRTESSPETRTSPLDRSVALWRQRGSIMLRVSVHCPVDGL
jgi:hypothetical protein